MTKSLPPLLRRLARAPAEARRGLATSLMERDLAWEDWLSALSALHVEAPELEARAAGALAAAAGRRRDAVLAARLRLLEGRGLQRSGSPVQAVRAFRRAASALRAQGDDDFAVQADVLCVDALAVAGRTRDALQMADEAAARIRGPRARLWRGALAVNRANALRLRGDLKEAVATYERAARGLERAGDAHTAAIARTNAGTARLDGGDARGARTRFAEALATFEAAGHADLALEVRYNLAGAVVRDGHPGEGLVALERLAEEHEARGLERRAALCRMDLADALLRSGDRASAEAQALEAAAGFRRCGAHAERVEALWYGAAAAAHDAPRRARAHLRRAHAAAHRCDRPALGMRCDLLEADLSVREGRATDVPRVRRLIQRATALGQDGLADEGHLLLGHLALRRGRVRDAHRYFTKASPNRPGRPWTWAAAHTGRALAEARLGREGAAIARLRRVADFLDAVRAGLPGAWLRTSFVVDHLDPYLARVDLLLDRNRAADRREATAVLDALALRRFRERTYRLARSDALEDSRKRLANIYDRLARGDGATRGLGENEQPIWEKEARRLERSVAEKWRRRERTTRPGASVPTARPTRLRTAADVTGIYVWRREDRILALAGGRRKPERVVDLGTVAELRDRLALLAFHEARLARSAAAGRSISIGLDALAVYVLLPLEPVTWRRRVRLILDPDLPDAPWELLPYDERPLAAAFDLLRVPALGAITGRRAGGVRSTAVVTLGEGNLPGAREESARLGDLVLEGPAATRHALAEALASHDVVHVAGHGFDAPEAPPLGGVRVADGWFSAADVPDRVRARLVVLAACRTGRVQGMPGQAWGGLPSALLAAGARIVVWTADDVEDRVTAELMQNFHRECRRATAVRAFGRALERTQRSRGHAGGLLPFRISGVES